METPLEGIRAAVQEHGYQVVLCPTSGATSAYGFTIGLGPKFGHPELVILGLDHAEPDGATHELLESAVEAIADGGRFEPGSIDRSLLETHSLAVRRVSAGNVTEYLGAAELILGTAVEAVQLVWPDRRGLLPWSPACDPAVRERQPLLDAE